MLSEDASWDQQCDEIRGENKEMLGDFEQWLRSRGLGDKTVKSHVANVAFFVDHALLYEDLIRPKDGWRHIDYFLGYWFIRKAMWASPTSIRSNATSLKKFYTFLHERGEVSDAVLSEVKETVKEGLPEWIATVERYDDPSVEDPFGFF